MRPSNISRLVSACTGRGAQIASSGPSSQPDVVGAPITTGPVAGHVLGAVDCEVVPARTQRRATGAAGARSSRCGGARTPAVRGQVPVDAVAAVTRRLTRAASAASTSATTWSTTSSRVYGVVSMWTRAVGHRQRRGGPAGVDRVAARAGRPAVAATSAPPFSAVRRAARAAGVGGQVDLDLGARGHTTEPMSRPSTTMPPSPMIVALQLEQPGAHLGDGADRR